MMLALLGDVSGHADGLVDVLDSLGVELTGMRIPDDLVVCQLGNLTGPGPANHEALGIAGQLMANNPGQWIQIIGQRELADLTSGDDHADPYIRALTRTWAEDGRLHPAYAFTTLGIPLTGQDHKRVQMAQGDLLVSHAGLTAGLWHDLGRPGGAAAAVEAINERYLADDPAIWQNGYEHSGAPSLRAGLAQARADMEVHASWARIAATGGQAPFHQAHAHSSVFHYLRNNWTAQAAGSQRAALERQRNGASPADWIPTSHVETSGRHTLTRIAGSVILGLHPEHGILPADTWTAITVTLDQSNPATS